MNDTDYMENVYDSTDEAGFRVMTWYNAGTRNFYATTPIYTPDDLKGLKIQMCIRDRSFTSLRVIGSLSMPLA